MSYFGRNIKKIRTAKKISQTAFADLFDLKRGSIGAYEEGRAEAKIETIIEIASYYKLTLDQLLCKELTFNEIYHVPEINQKFENSNFRIASDFPIPLISAKDRSEFIKKFNNQAYLKGLNSINLNNAIEYSLAFELINNDLAYEASGLRQGDIIIAETFNIKDLENYLPNANFIILVTERMHIAELNLVGNQFVLKSLNPGYLNYHIKNTDIQAIYKPIWLLTNKIQFNSAKDINLSSIENKLDKILKSKGLL